MFGEHGFDLEVTRAGSRTTEPFESFEAARDAFREAQNDTMVSCATMFRLASDPQRSGRRKQKSAVFDYENHEAEDGGRSDKASAELSEADHIYATARDMQSASCALVERNTAKGERRFTSSLHFLLGFSVELYLKAALAQFGVPSTKRHGHDLQRLMRRAEGKGLLAFPNLEAFRKVVDILAKGHGELSFRYSKPGTTLSIIEFKSMPDALTVMQSLDDHLREKVNVKAAMSSLPPQQGEP